jgi:hypothetical protein
MLIEPHQKEQVKFIFYGYTLSFSGKQTWTMRLLYIEIHTSGEESSTDHEMPEET